MKSLYYQLQLFTLKQFLDKRSIFARFIVSEPIVPSADIIVVILSIVIPGALIIFFLLVFLLAYPSYPLKWIIKIRVNTKLDFPNGYPIRRKTDNQC